MANSLDRLEPGEQGTVARLLLSPARAASLIRLGLRPGTEVLCLRRTPLGDPTVYRFRGTEAAIRRKDARKVIVNSE